MAPSSPMGSYPTATCLGFSGNHTQLLIVGCHGVHLLDVATWQWMKVHKSTANIMSYFLSTGCNLFGEICLTFVDKICLILNFFLFKSYDDTMVNNGFE